MRRVMTGMLALTAACGGGNVTTPSDWTLDIAPFPSTLTVGQKVSYRVVAMNRAADTRFDVSSATVISSRPLSLQVRSDTLVAFGIARVDITISGVLDGRGMTGQRTVIILPAPIGGS